MKLLQHMDDVLSSAAAAHQSGCTPYSMPKRRSVMTKKRAFAYSGLDIIIIFEPLLSLAGTTGWKQLSSGGRMRYGIYTGRDSW